MGQRNHTLAFPCLVSQGKAQDPEEKKSEKDQGFVGGLEKIFSEEIKAHDSTKPK